MAGDTNKDRLNNMSLETKVARLGDKLDALITAVNYLLTHTHTVNASSASTTEPTTQPANNGTVPAVGTLN